MIKPKLKKGDRILIREGKANFRNSNPKGEVVVIFIGEDEYNPASRFRATCPESGNNIDYWYEYNEIIKVLTAKPRKGKLIGGFAIQ